MSIAQELLNRGRKEGRDEGREEGRKELVRAVKKMLMRGMSVDEIMDITEISGEEIENIRKE